jgi:hypothetical protein
VAKLNMMAPDSAGFKVLLRLYELGGTAGLAELMPVIWSDMRSPERFQKVAGMPLVERGFVTSEADALHLTPEGRSMVERYCSLLPRKREQGYVMKPLDIKRHMRPAPVRSGALDYREIPSLMSGDRVPFKGGSVSGEGSNV